MYEWAFQATGLIGVRYQLVNTHNPATPLRLEGRVDPSSSQTSGHHFEAFQIPGYFTVGTSPLVKKEKYVVDTPTEFDHYTMFVYEPFSEDGEAIDGELGQGSTSVEQADGDHNLIIRANRVRQARLSSLYRGSMHGINACVSGISAYRTVYPKDGTSWGICLVRYPPESM